MANSTSSGRRLSLTACTMMVAASAAGTGWTEAPAGGRHAEEAVERIGRYCDASWRNARVNRDDWGDCTQEVFLRLLERCSPAGLQPAIDNPESAERRELNRSIWATAQRWRRAVRRIPLNEAAVSDHRESETVRRYELRALLASDCLSERQRQILAMYADGYAIAEIADVLGLAPARVSDEKYKAVARLARQQVSAAAQPAS